jgi:hypothetical protein
MSSTPTKSSKPEVPQLDYLGVGRMSTLDVPLQPFEQESITFPCVKTNKYGIKQKRLAVIDPVTKTIRILDLKEKCKKEFPVRMIESMMILVGQKKKGKVGVVLKFKDAKVYHLDFESENVRMEFKRACASVGISELQVTGEIQFNEDEDEGDDVEKTKPMPRFVEFKIWVEYGKTRKVRNMTIDTQRGVFRFLGKRRNVKEEYQLAAIISVDIFEKEIHQHEAAAAGLSDTILYSANVAIGDKKWIYHWFTDADRSIFCESLQIHTDVRYSGTNGVSLNGRLRDFLVPFDVVKELKIGSKANRRIYVDIHNKMIRNAVPGRIHRKIVVSDIQSIHKPFENRTHAKISFRHQESEWKLTFSSLEDREKFIGLCYDLMDQKPVIEEGDSIEFETQKVVPMFIGSWNVGDTIPTDCPNIKDSIGSWILGGNQIYVIGLQECKRSDMWVQYLHKCVEILNDHEFSIVTSELLWGILIVIFVRNDIMPRVTSVRQAVRGTGIGDVMGNKGGAAVLFRFDNSSICFVCSHLAARFEKVAERLDDYHKIIESVHIGDTERDILNQFHHVIWFGDLNFRLETEFNETLQLIGNNEISTLLSSDQLLKEMGNGNIFVGFKEMPITFAPTYRMLRDREGYSNKKNQSPSWTDRILSLSLIGCENELIAKGYNSAPKVLGSDHRPIYCLYDFTPRKHPLTGDLDVMIEISCIKFSKYVCLSSINDEIIVIFSGSFLEDKPTSLQGKVAHDLKTVIWDGFEIPSLNPIFKDPDYLESCHLEVSIVKRSGKDKEIIGFSVLSLEGISPNSKTTKNKVTYYGQLIGEITLEVSIRVVEEEKMSKMRSFNDEDSDESSASTFRGFNTAASRPTAARPKSPFLEIKHSS